MNSKNVLVSVININCIPHLIEWICVSSLGSIEISSSTVTFTGKCNWKMSALQS